MMTNELRAAAERLTGNSWDVYIPHPETKRNWMDIADKILMDGRDLARAYLAGNDETPITAEWLRSILGSPEPGLGFRFGTAMAIANSDNGWGLYFHGTFGDGLLIIDDEGDELTGMFRLKDVRNRGQLIRLAKALGIELKETT